MKSFKQFLPSESVEIHDANGNLAFEVIDVIKPEPLKKSTIEEKTKLPIQRNGQVVDTYLRWRGKNFMIQMFFPQLKKPSRKEVLDQLQKVYPGCKIWSWQVTDYNPGAPVLHICY